MGLPAPITTTPCIETALATQAMRMVPPREAAPQSDVGLPIERRHAHQEGQRAQAHARQLSIEQQAMQ
jgi:hypothetical protein